MTYDDVAVCVLAAEGRKDDTEMMLRDLAPDAEPFPNKSLTWFGESSPPDVAGWPALWVYRKPMGHVGDYFGFLESALHRWPKCSRYILLEDDVVLCTRALHVMARFPIPKRVGFVSFFNAAQQCAVRPGADEQRAGPYTYFYGTQAVVFDKRKLRDAACYSPIPGGHPGAGDVQLGKWAFARGYSWLRYYPSLVQHTGTESLANPGAGMGLGRVAPTFHTDYDALSDYETRYAGIT